MIRASTPEWLVAVVVRRQLRMLRAVCSSHGPYSRTRTITTTWNNCSLSAVGIHLADAGGGGGATSTGLVERFRRAKLALSRARKTIFMGLLSGTERYGAPFFNGTRGMIRMDFGCVSSSRYPFLPR